MRTKLLAVLAGSAIALSASSPAVAATWDGNSFNFGLGEDWGLDSNFYIEDVDLGGTSVGFTQPFTNGVLTDIWDGSLDINVRSTAAGVDSGYDCTGNVSDIDISTVADDLVISCQADWDEPTNADVNIRGEIRIYGPDGDLVRYTLGIENTSNSDITDFVVRTDTNWGSDGDIWAYQNYDASVLAVPASEDYVNAEKLRSVDSNWAVNYTGADAPGSLAWGNNNGSVDVGLWDTDGVNWDTETDTFTVAAGETVYLVYFTGWDPANLISNSFAHETWTDDNGDIASTAVADAAAEFDSFSGRLTRGLPAGANVVNWASAPEGEELATTGADNVSIWAGLGLLVAGVAGRAIRRRVRA
jgi:hypothetical protein